MTCFITQNLLSEYIDGDLTPDRLRELETHLGGCDGCQAELNKTRAVRKMLRSMPIERAPVGFVDRVNAKVASRSPVRRAGSWVSRVFSRPLVYAGAATAAVLVVAVGFMRGGGLIQISDLMGPERGVQESNNELAKAQTDGDTFQSGADLQPEHARQDKPRGIQGEGAAGGIDGIQGEKQSAKNGKVISDLAANRRAELPRKSAAGRPDAAVPGEVRARLRATPAATPAAMPTSVAMAKVRDESAERAERESLNSGVAGPGATTGGLVRGGSPTSADRLSESRGYDSSPSVEETEESSEAIVVTSEKKSGGRWWQRSGKKKGKKSKERRTNKDKKDATAATSEARPAPAAPVTESAVAKRAVEPSGAKTKPHSARAPATGRSRAARPSVSASGDSFADGGAEDLGGDDLGDTAGGGGGDAFSVDADGGPIERDEAEVASAGEPVDDPAADDDSLDSRAQDREAREERRADNANDQKKSEVTATAAITGHVYRVKSSVADAPAQIITAAKAVGGIEKLWPSGPPQLTEDTKYVTLQIEIPSGKLAEFRAAVGQFGTETLRSQPASDEDPVVLRVSISLQRAPQ